MTNPVVLPADIYDTIELAAFAFGGIGAGDDFMLAPDGESYLPYCVHGLACEANAGSLFDNPIRDALYRAGIGRGANDGAVLAINARLGRGQFSRKSRVPFEDWRAELNVVRGE